MVRNVSLLVASVLFVLGATAGLDLVSASAERPASRKDLHDSMRRLWTDHVVWTRQFVVSELADLPDQGAATARLLRNQRDIGDAIVPFFGRDAGDALTALLTDHILIAARLVAALEEGDAAAAEAAAAAAAWRENADDIAEFLSEANPQAWPFEEMQEMLHEHLDLTTDEVAARLSGDWEADVAAFDEILTQALEMADMLTDGLRGPGRGR